MKSAIANLFSVLFLGLALLVPPSLAQSLAGDQLSAPEAWERAKTQEIMLIDVRTPAEWRQTGMPATALGNDWWQDGGKTGFIERILALTGGRRDRPIAVICARGIRSGAARQLLSESGFTKVYDIGEGMLGSRQGPGWLKRDLPLEACRNC